jgi:hypothetical protein
MSSGKSAGVAVGASMLDTKTATSITINAVTAPANGQTVEYIINSTDSAPASGWHNGLTFNGLNADTAYFIFARSKENADFNAGMPSESLKVTTSVLIAVSLYTTDFYWDSDDNQIACYWKTTSTGMTTKTVLSTPALSDAEAYAIAV